MENYEIWIAVLLSIYEILSRVIPTNKVWSIIGKIIQILKAISDALDRKKK